jgi:Ni/Fe-hydrogenase subunit HybB-like protein
VRASPRGLVAGAFLTVLGFVMHRLNVSVTGMEGAAGTRYIPSVMEIAVSVGLVAAGFALFAVANRYLPIFPAEAGQPEAEVEEEAALAAGG